MTSPRTIFIVVAAATIAATPAMAIDAERQAAPVSPLIARPLEQLSATRNRPLFSPTRRPPAPPPIVAAEPPAPTPPPEVALLGIVMDGEEARAVIRTGPTAKVMRVRIGDEVGGWKVGQIESQRLVLVLDGRTATFAIFTSTNINRPANAGALSQAPMDRGSGVAAQPPPSPNGPTTSNPETTRVRRPHLQQQ
jgi:hypothetical protein